MTFNPRPASQNLMKFQLESISTLPGVHQAAVGDDAGRLLDCAGWEEPPTAAMLVLAHATLAAAAELGRRSGTGDCLEIIQQHEGGCIYLYSLPQRRVLLVRCQHSSAIPAVRVACHRCATSAEEVLPVSRPAVRDLAAAFHAEPAW